jgi:hypothetical protein
VAAEQAGHFGGRLQVALGVGLEPEAGVLERAGLADAGEDVEKGLAAGMMVAHRVGGDEGGGMARRQAGEAVEPGPVAAAIEHVGDEVQGRAVERAADMGEGGLEVLAGPGLGRQQGEDQSLAMVRDIGQREMAFALSGPALAERQEPAQPPVSRPVGRPGEQGEA